KMINEERKNRGLSVLGSDDGRTEDGHPYASFLRISAENHELGSMSQQNLQEINLSSNTNDFVQPSLQHAQALLSEVRKSASGYQLNVFLDNSGRDQVIESRIENFRGRIIKSFKSITTKSALATLGWDHKDDEGKTVKEGIYLWHVVVNGILHTGTVNDFSNI
ncbi:MAG: hypothetical protein MI975_17540, partial [Cytophagales bacterium]|nr:hypothetical protein [Cytophagales bacterium]